jgi:hypothetical protein
MNIVLVIASLGRAQLLGSVLEHWAAQTRPLDHRILSVTSPADCEGIRAGLVDETLLGDAGLCKQRNRALEFMLASRPDIVIFADDDYVPSRNFVEAIDLLFRANEDIMVASGHMIADGVTTGGIALSDAVGLVAAYDSAPRTDARTMHDVVGGYGCNMAIRVSANRSIRCDERLPLYGWQEDIDYTRQYLRHGRIVKTNAFAGVHMGSPGARSPGMRLGYSQIINPVYLMLKGTMPVHWGLKLMCKNFLANCFGTVAGDKKVDRPGRLKGNLIGLRRIVLGDIRPEYILKL